MAIPNEDKEWVLDALEDLILRCGAKTFVAAPLLLPSNEYFPDDLEEGAVGVRTLIRRKMRHAGLEALTVKLDIIPDGANLGASAPIMFTEVKDHEAHFELFEEPGPEELLGFLCFEVAHAYRASRNLDKIGSAYRDTIETDPEVVNRLAAVTTIYLGSGLLASNAAEVKSTHGDFASYSVKHTFAGGLPPEIMAWALGVQSVVRNRDEETKKLLAHLKLNETAVFKKARKELLAHRDTLLGRLGLPEESAWPAPQPVDNGPLKEDLAGSLTIEETREDGMAASAGAERKSRVVYRVVESRGDTSGWVMTLLTSLVTMLVLFIASANLAVTVVGGITGFVLMFWLVIRGEASHCSEPDCRTKMSADDLHCAGCGIRIAGEVSSRLEALDLPRYGLRAELDDDSIDDSFALREAHELAEAALHEGEADDP